MLDVAAQLAELASQALVEGSEQRAADAKVDEERHAGDHNGHRHREGKRQPQANRQASQTPPSSRSLYPVPRTVSSEVRPNGRSILSRSDRM